MKQLTAIDLFCGAGGLTLGLKETGFKTLFAIDFDPQFSETFTYNFPKIKLFVEDITNFTDEKIIESVGDNTIDIIVGGPPCQGFSIAGNIGRQFLDDDRNHLFKEFVRFVDVIKPKVFLMENVASLATHNRGKSLKEIIKAFENINYDVVYKVLNAADYGVPQERRRIFIIGTYNQKNTFIFPKEIPTRLTIFDAIEDLPPLKSGEESTSIPNHKAMNHTKQMLDKMSYVTDGGDRTQIPEHLRPKSGDARKYIRYNSKKPAPTVTGDMRKIFHYKQNRALTPRELARLQSFPDSFIFKGSSINVQQKIGNAVPPKLAKTLFLSIKEQLLNE